MIRSSHESKPAYLLQVCMVNCEVLFSGDIVQLHIPDVIPINILPGFIISDKNDRPAKQCNSFTQFTKKIQARMTQLQLSKRLSERILVQY